MGYGVVSFSGLVMTTWSIFLPLLRLFLVWSLEVKMAFHCNLCGFFDFRTSRFRFKLRNLANLLLLRFPVRCLNCDERKFTSLRNYLAVRRAQKERLLNPSIN